MKKEIIIRLHCLIVLMALSQVLYSQDNSSLPRQDSLNNENRLPFKNISVKKSAGSVVTIDVQQELKRDKSSTIASILNGKVPGLFGSTNTWGTGNAALLVDGVRQSDFYINSLNPFEVSSIVILKDALSKAMYGSQADAGVILITTMRGKAGDQKLRVTAQLNGATPRAMPKYLNAADYMEKYNEAQLNDGIAPASLRYKQEVINATRSGENLARYPDNDFYSADYIRKYTTGAEVFADVSGGSENARYYVNTGWNRNNGWLNTAQSDVTDNFNVRGNLDFGINKYLDMNINTTARLSFNQQPNANSIWATASTELPNNYPILWDPSIIQDEDLRNRLLKEANLVNGQLLGGNSSYLNNVYGNFTQAGNKRFMQRDIQFSGKLNLDMRFITEGLSASFFGGMNFYNTLYSNQNTTFAVYEPVFNPTTGLLDAVNVHGADKAANQYNTNNVNSDFFRHGTYYATMNYNRSFNKHEISGAALVYTDLITNKDVLQKDVLFHTGFSGAYMYSGKYLAEVSVMGIGSRKLKEGSRVEPAPSFGLGWVLSEEEFMSDVSFINYLKIRSSYGITKNDRWNDYNLYRTTFIRGSSFTYQNGVSANSEINYFSVPNDIKLQKRRDFTLGAEASLFSKAMNVELQYFNSASIGNITQMASTYPQILGFENLVYSNYNSNKTTGIELGVNYRFAVTKDFSITAGSNLLYASPKITKHEEPAYEGVDAALLRKGTATDAMWALKSNGLYSEADFNSDGSLVAGLPVPMFGAIRPGDIKYLDQNGDNIIDQKDERIIGHGLRTQYGFHLDINYKNFGFYILGIGQAGAYDYRSGNYYRVFGNVKYSEMANAAYGPNNKDANALHPRLSTTNSSNNNRDSDYWVYKNNSFIIPAMQLTYSLPETNKLLNLKDSRIYVRADNAFVFGENKKYTETNVSGSPRTRSFAVGLMTSF